MPDAPRKTNLTRGSLLSLGPWLQPGQKTHADKPAVFNGLTAAALRPRLFQTPKSHAAPSERDQAPNEEQPRFVVAHGAYLTVLRDGRHNKRHADHYPEERNDEQ